MSVIQGAVVVFCGFTKDEVLETFIAENGGTVRKALSSKTTMVVAKPGCKSKMLAEAQAQPRVTILTPDEFKDKFIITNKTLDTTTSVKTAKTTPKAKTKTTKKDEGVICQRMLVALNDLANALTKYTLTELNHMKIRAVATGTMGYIKSTRTFIKPVKVKAEQQGKYDVYCMEFRVVLEDAPLLFVEGAQLPRMSCLPGCEIIGTNVSRKDAFDVKSKMEEIYKNKLEWLMLAYEIFPPPVLKGDD